jgi:hypothetical protein
MAVIAHSAAVHAGARQIADLCFGKRLSICQPVDPDPGYAVKFVRFVVFTGDVVFGHTGRHTGTASGTFIQIDDHPVFFPWFMFCFFAHRNLFRNNYP